MREWNERLSCFPSLTHLTSTGRWASGTPHVRTQGKVSNSNDLMDFVHIDVLSRFN